MCCCCCGNTGIAGVTGIGNFPINGIPAAGPLQVTLTFDGITGPESQAPIGNFYAGEGVTFSSGLATNHDYGGGHTTIAQPWNELQFTTTFNFYEIAFDWMASGTTSIILYQGATVVYNTGELPGTGGIWTHNDWNIHDLTAGAYTTANGMYVLQLPSGDTHLDTIVMTYNP